MIFETARLIVCPWRPDDAEEAFAIYRDPLVTRYLGEGRRHLFGHDLEYFALDAPPPEDPAPRRRA